MDLEHLNLLRLELHEVKTKAQKESTELEKRRLFIEALEMAIFRLESVRELEAELEKLEEARKMDSEIIKSWATEDKVKAAQIEALKEENKALAAELIKKDVSRSGTEV